MTNVFPAAEAAAILVERRISGVQGERLPVACRPQNLEQALAIAPASSLGDLVAASSRFWTAGPTVRWPLFAFAALLLALVWPAWRHWKRSEQARAVGAGT